MANPNIDECLFVFDYDVKDIGQKCDYCDQCVTGYQPHMWRKLCSECKCERNNHDIIAEYSSRSRLSFIGKTDHIDAKSLGYCWVPAGLTIKQIDLYFSQLPTTEIPRIGSFGERNRNKRLIVQLPKQDLSLKFAKHIEPSNEIVFENFIIARNNVALDLGQVISLKNDTDCASCHQLIPVNTLVVHTSKNNQLIWHPNCFRCYQCTQLLVDLIYCLYDDEIFCQRHYAEKFKPRCATCDEASKNLVPIEKNDVIETSNIITDASRRLDVPNSVVCPDPELSNEIVPISENLTNNTDENKSRILRNRKRFRRKSSIDASLTRDEEIQAFTELEKEEQKKLKKLRKSKELTNQLTEGLNRIFNRAITGQPASSSRAPAGGDPFWVNRRS